MADQVESSDGCKGPLSRYMVALVLRASSTQRLSDASIAHLHLTLHLSTRFACLPTCLLTACLRNLYLRTWRNQLHNSNRSVYLIMYFMSRLVHDLVSSAQAKYELLMLPSIPTVTQPPIRLLSAFDIAECSSVLRSTSCLDAL
jgi:hypothetical protein